MKIFGVSVLIFAFSILTITSSIHDYSLLRMEGGYQALSDFGGKKIMIISLPIQQNASGDSMLFSLDTLASAHSSELAVIGVPSREEGYTNSIKDELQEWYRSKLGSYVTLSDGIYTRKESGANQHPLYQWMTSDTLNGTFNINESGPGTMYFANGQGKLYSVLRPQSKVSGKSVQKALSL